MRRLIHICLVTIALLGASAAAHAFEPASTGVVVVHGKWGRPGAQSNGELAQRLEQAGFLVEQPDMPWSGTRLYDRPYDAAMDDIEAAVQRLRARGATKIVVAGHSLGGSGALKYATLGKPVDVIVMIDPAHFPESPFSYQRALESITRARAMVNAGKGDETGSFIDLNSDDRSRMMTFTAAIYMSYYASDGPAAMSLFAPRTGPAPILWIAGTMDQATRAFERIAWGRIGGSTPKTRIDVPAHHMDAPVVGAPAIIDWIKAR